VKISIIGGGNLGSALIQGFLRAKGEKASDILVCDLDKRKIPSLKRKFKVRTTNLRKEALNFSSILILAVKPKDMHKSGTGSYFIVSEFQYKFSYR